VRAKLAGDLAGTSVDGDRFWRIVQPNFHRNRGRSRRRAGRDPDILGYWALDIYDLSHVADGKVDELVVVVSDRWRGGNVYTLYWHHRAGRVNIFGGEQCGSFLWRADVHRRGDLSNPWDVHGALWHSVDHFSGTARYSAPKVFHWSGSGFWWPSCLNSG
jgi:hypothetical protein